MMKSKLDSVLPAGKVKHVEYSDNEIYIADYTARTNSQKDIEVSNIKLDDMEVLTLKNEALLSITFSIFGKQCFMDEQNKEIKHCECVLYPTNSMPDTWILFVEIKDCKPKNISKYFVSAKEQIIRTVKLFHDRSLLNAGKKVHAVISFPRKKVDFHSNIITQEVRQNFLHQHGIIIRASNTVSIENNKSIV